MNTSRISLASILLVITVVVLLTAIYFYPSEKNDNFASQGWRMIYGNPQGNCLGSYNTSSLTGKIMWSKSFKDGVGGLVVDGNGMLYVLTMENIIHLNNRGDTLWELDMNFSFPMPAIDEYGNLYAARAYSVISLNEDGNIRWEFNFQNERVTAPLIVQNHILYVLTSGANLYMLSYKGKLLGKIELKDETYLPPLLSPQGEIYIGVKNAVYKFSLDGKREWKLSLKGEILNMALYEDMLYVTIDTDSHSFKSMLYLLSISDKGDINREIYLNNFVEEWRTVKSLAVDKDGVYVGIAPAALPCGATKSYGKNEESNSFIMKFDKRGNLIWKIGFYKIIEGLAISRDGLLYATFSGYPLAKQHCELYELNKRGEILWYVSLGYYIHNPVIGPDAIYAYGGHTIYSIG